MRVWKERYRELYLDSFLCTEGRGRMWLQDTRCWYDGCEATATFRCRDCAGLVGFCRECILRRHRCEPFHILEVRLTILLTPNSNKACVGMV
jgi:hypothetical protein